MEKAKHRANKQASEKLTPHLWLQGHVTSQSTSVLGGSKCGPQPPCIRVIEVPLQIVGSWTINKMKRQPTDQEKIFANDVTNKGLVSKIYKQLMTVVSKQTAHSKTGQKT